MFRFYKNGIINFICYTKIGLQTKQAVATGFVKQQTLIVDCYDLQQCSAGSMYYWVVGVIGRDPRERYKQRGKERLEETSREKERRHAVYRNNQ